MLPPPGKLEDNPYFCNCKKCALHGGRVLPRTTWYNHNPGGKGNQLPTPSLEDIEYIMNLPTRKFTQVRQRHFEERRVALRMQISKRATG
jgi:hypothetical protein